MELILLKSSACLLAFIAFYKVFLERTSSHQFKRFYLLAVVLISIGIPFITFIEYIDPLMNFGHFDINGMNTPPYFPPETAIEETKAINHLPTILWSIYGFGVVLFSFRFAYNFVLILLKIKRNPKQKTSSFISVLLQDYVVPHTFFNYVFFNKTKFENKEIPSEVLLHEETHAKQMHSIDILFIELLQIIFWFNPLIYILKKDIKLNHEFLADQGVIIQGIKPSNYQQLLLEFSSNSSSNHLANAINYSLIKKRFTVMKTKTSKQSLRLRSFLLLPLLALLIYGFSSTKQVEKEIIPKMSTDEIVNASNYSITDHTARSISITIFNNGTYEIDGIKTTKKTFVSVINQLHQDISPEIRNQIMNIHLNSKEDISNEEVWFIYNSVIDYGFHRIATNNQEIIRGKGNKPFAISSAIVKKEIVIMVKSNQITLNSKPSSLQTFEKDMNAITKDWEETDYTSIKPNVHIKNSSNEFLKKLEYEFSKTHFSKANEGMKLLPPPPPAPKVVKGELSNIPPPPPPINIQKQQNPPTQKEIDAYNTWAKKIHSESTSISDKATLLPIVYEQNLIKFSEIYNRMSLQQKNESVKFPFPGLNVKENDLSLTPPPPPPPIPANATKEQKLKYEKIHKEYHEKYSVKNGQVSEKLPPPPPPKNSSVEERKRYEVERVRYEKAKRVRMVEREKMIERESQMLKRVKERDHVIQERELKRKEIEYARKEIELKREEREHAMKERKLKMEEIKNKPRPQSPLDHVINQAKKGATFYYEGKQITSDKAIKLLKENNRINISSKDSNGSNPTVHLSTEPIKINNREASKPTADNIKSHIKVMNRHGATFYLGNDKITFEEALKYVKKNRDADVTSSTASNVVIIRKP